MWANSCELSGCRSAMLANIWCCSASRWTCLASSADSLPNMLTLWDCTGSTASVAANWENTVAMWASISARQANTAATQVYIAANQASHRTTAMAANMSVMLVNI